MSKAGKVCAVAVLAALAWAVAPVTEAQPPIRIGATLSLTGAYAAIGQNQHRGYQLCVEDMNRKGGVLGRKLELVLYDDESDPVTAVRLYEKLITQDKVDWRRASRASRRHHGVSDERREPNAMTRSGKPS